LASQIAASALLRLAQGPRVHEISIPSIFRDDTQSITLGEIEGDPKTVRQHLLHTADTLLAMCPENNHAFWAARGCIQLHLMRLGVTTARSEATKCIHRALQLRPDSSTYWRLLGACAESHRIHNECLLVALYFAST